MNSFLYFNSLLHHKALMDKNTGREKNQKQFVSGNYHFLLISKGEK
jgi:hypothetical protein